MRRNLLIKADPENGVEIINQLLEFDGVRNKCSYTGKESVGGYFINGNKIIDCYEYLIDQSSYYKIMTLEEFQTKFPFKPGDQVIIDGDEDLQLTPVYKIKEGLIWDSEHEEVIYQLSHVICSLITLAPASKLILYSPKSNNEETIKKYNVEKYLKVWEETEHGLEVVVNDKFELKEIDGKFYLIEKCLEYPKTYEECCEVLGVNPSFDIKMLEEGESTLYFNFIDLVRCRNAYWKIAGEQMGLGKPWEPDFLNDEQPKFCLYNSLNNVLPGVVCETNEVLVFPTEEMRDIFYENFKDLIEKCKELL